MQSKAFAAIFFYYYYSWFLELKCCWSCLKYFLVSPEHCTPCLLKDVSRDRRTTPHLLNMGEWHCLLTWPSLHPLHPLLPTPPLQTVDCENKRQETPAGDCGVVWPALWQVSNHSILSSDSTSQSEISFSLFQPIRDEYQFVLTNQRSVFYCCKQEEHCQTDKFHSLFLLSFIHTGPTYSRPWTWGSGGSFRK